MKKIFFTGVAVAVSVLTLGSFSFFKNPPTFRPSLKNSWVATIAPSLDQSGPKLGTPTELECPDASQRGKLLSTTWPVEVVPIYPNANELKESVTKPSKLIAPNCSKITYQYGLQADNDTASAVYQWYKGALLDRGFKITKDSVSSSIYEDSLGNKVTVSLSFSEGPNVSGFVGLQLTLELKKTPQGRCPQGDQGQQGQTCPSANKCDLAGGCNPACCAKDSECPGSQKCNLDNGYCRSGLSCNPQ